MSHTFLFILATLFLKAMNPYFLKTHVNHLAVVGLLGFMLDMVKMVLYFYRTK